MRFLYNFLIFLYKNGIRVAAIVGNEKAQKWLSGRKNLFKKLESTIRNEDKIIWFHCASLGEFEQGRTLIESIRSSYPEYKILLTFFSPSGYEIRKDYALADYVFYLPADTPRNARKFIGIVKPRMAFFIKYEFWFNYMNELYKHKIPYYMVSVIFRPSQHFFKLWGSWSRRQLRKVTYLFVQDKQSLELLDHFRLFHANIIGDTRFDRVAVLPFSEERFMDIERFIKNRPSMVAGSTWPADEEKIEALLNQESQDLKLVIAPHEIGKEHIDNLRKRFQKYGVTIYSEGNDSGEKDANVLIIDKIGILSTIYRYATIAYVGGGFGAGIHNILEAAVYGIPVIFGPNHKKFNEATDLLHNGGGYAVHSTEELISVTKNLLANPEKRKESALNAKRYVDSQTGATQKVIEKAKEFLSV